MGDLGNYHSKIDYIADHTGLPILECKDISLEDLKSILLDALDRHRKKCSANKEKIE